MRNDKLIYYIMVISKLILNDAHSMNEQEMKRTKAGVGIHEYCCVLFCIAEHNESGWSHGALQGSQYGMIQICEQGGFLYMPECHFNNGTCDYIG